jgi:hypothetical protein
MGKAKDDGDALRKWRDAEATTLQKNDLPELVQLRVKADPWRETYFHEGHAKHKERPGRLRAWATGTGLVLS